MIQMEAQEYKTRSEFAKESPSAYDRARQLKILDEVCSHMTKPKPKHKWTEVTIKEEALKYKTRSEFAKESPSAYARARRLGLLNEVCSHMFSSISKTSPKWTEETIKEEALKYKTRSEFAKGSPSAYDKARRSGLLNEVCSHMPKRREQPKMYRLISKPSRQPKWNYFTMKAEAERYTTRTQFAQGSSGAYDQARLEGCLDDICEHMEVLKRHWDEESVTEVAKTYDTKTEFAQLAGGAYHWARQFGILDKICSHMKGRKVEDEYKYYGEAPDPKEIVMWSEDAIRTEAKKYSTRREFQDAQPEAYLVAKQTGVLNSVCMYMKDWNKELDDE